jgi:hypothetical protein
MVVVFLLILTQLTLGDLMKIDYDFSTGLSIPLNRLTVEYITKEYWSTSEALFRLDQLEILEQHMSQMIVFDKELLTFPFDNLLDSFRSDKDLLVTPLYETTLYTTITDIGSDSFKESASVSSYDLSDMIGKKGILDSNLWH